MDPIFTISYPEYAVAHHLRSALPQKDGYSIHVPLSRQEKGVDLVLTRRFNGITRAAGLQVKGSRTYSPTSPKMRERHMLYNTWYNTFRVPEEADFFLFIGIYPPEIARSSKKLDTFWASMILMFTNRELVEFFKSVKTVGGKPDSKFSFGFDEPDAVCLTRGDPLRGKKDYSAFLLQNRADDLKSFLSS
jgi:hypothetical protein